MEYIKEIETFSIYHFIVNYPKNWECLQFHKFICPRNLSQFERYPENTSLSGFSDK